MPEHPILSRYPVLLLDMNGTFMFDQDRFSPDEDYHAAYRRLAGDRLPADAVSAIVTECIECITAIYHDPASETVPQVREVLRDIPQCQTLPPAELDLLEAVVSHHELGRIDEAHAAALRALASTHRLGLISNLWSKKPPWLDELRRAGVLDLFEALAFSSDGAAMKPSPRIFHAALAQLQASPESAVYIGDNFHCDVAGAATARLDAIWINPHGAPRPVSSPQPVLEVQSLLDLVK